MGGDVPSLARSAYVMQLVASPREMDFDSRPATTACHLNLFCMYDADPCRELCWLASTCATGMAGPGLHVSE